jgi:glutaredoxin
MTSRLEGHSIYGYPQCPFCSRVLRAAEALDLDIEFRNTIENPEYQRDVAEATGRTTVPVLRIESEDGAVRWMPESADIMAYLENVTDR